MSPSHRASSQQYTAWKVRFNLALQDPDTTGTRYHTTIFVETAADKSGDMFHVTGDITSGMSYQMKYFKRPEGSQSFHSREFLGYTAIGTFPEQWDELLSAVPPPERQKAFNTKTRKTELVKSWSPLAFYKPNEPKHQPFKCTEWTEQRAVPALRDAGLLVSTRSG